MSGSESLSTNVATAPRTFWNVPNTLTVSRLVLAVCVFALIANEWYFGALVIFAIAAITDALDGYFARLLKQDTPLGRQLDPLVDKVIVAGAYIYLATDYRQTGVMPWMVTAIVVRELLIQGLRSHLEGRGQAFGARMAGKLKTVVQCLSICMVLFCLAQLPSRTDVLWWIRDGLTWLAVILTIYSGLSYLWIALPNFRSST
jgi:CDP-diacylglycerol--glycerol-3-phosphate 3-phosphatidyltransferase